MCIDKILTKARLQMVDIMKEDIKAKQTENSNCFGMGSIVDVDTFEIPDYGFMETMVMNIQKNLGAAVAALPLQLIEKNDV